MKKIISKAPHYRSGPIRLADFAEISALKGPRFQSSEADLIGAFDRLEDEDEDKFESPVKEAFAELAHRSSMKGNFNITYPFTLEKDTISLNEDALSDEKKLLYIFLLLTTSLNMKSDRIFALLDGAELFELLSKEVAVRFFGGPNDKRVRAKIFGTSRQIWESKDGVVDNNDLPKFEQAINDLCNFWGEGDSYKPKTDKVTAKDDKLDIVVCRDFSDGMHAKLTGFGQCKTGTHWINELPRLQPSSFCNRWLDCSPAVQPVKLYFLTDRVSHNELRHHGYEAGIIFERCRILDYAEDLPVELIGKCAKWTRAALKKYQMGDQ
jgi:hypothetical protein